MKLTQNPLRLSICLATSLVMFTGASIAQEIQCPPGYSSMEDPEHPGKFFCVDPIALANGEHFTSPHSGISIQLSPNSESTESQLEAYEQIQNEAREASERAYQAR